MSESEIQSRPGPPGGMPDPTPIMQLATGYWASATMLTANDLGLFAALAMEPLDAEGVAKAAGADPRATEILLNGCCGLGLMRKEGERYTLTPATAAFMVPGRPGYLGSAIRWSAHQYEAWGRLAETVRTGQPAAAPEMHLGDDPERTRAFVMAMHERAQGMARGVIGFLDLEDCGSLLDVGGGPGTFAVLLAQRYPDLKATVIDLPAVVAIGGELIAEAGMAERIRTQAGDATSGDYGEAAYDAVLFSGVLHQMAEPTIRRMFAGAYKALRPGGKVTVSDMMLDATKTQPVFSALFSLQMLLTSREGAVFAAEECSAWLQDAGFAAGDIRRLPAPLPYTVVSSTKPGA